MSRHYDGWWKAPSVNELHFYVGLVLTVWFWAIV